MKCENCGNKHDGSYGSGRFCCQKCARSFSSKNCRNKYKEVKCIECNNIFKIKINGRINNFICSDCRNKKKIKYNIINRKKDKKELFDFNNSPYRKDFDTAYLNYNKQNEPYLYLINHDKNNKIIKRHMVYLYRYNIELKLGRKLTSYEVIHHIDKNHNNNDLSNLIVLTRKIHNRLHKNIITMNDIFNENLYIAYFIK